MLDEKNGTTTVHLFLMSTEQRNSYCQRLPGLLNATDQEMFYIVDTSKEARNLITGET